LNQARVRRSTDTGRGMPAAAASLALVSWAILAAYPLATVAVFELVPSTMSCTAGLRPAFTSAAKRAGISRPTRASPWSRALSRSAARSEVPTTWKYPEAVNASTSERDSMVRSWSTRKVVTFRTSVFTA
jgi:hypothetical protein